MTFTKLTIQPQDSKVGQENEATNIWSIFRSLRDARSHFGLRAAHLQTLQAMLSFLKPGHGETVFASNYEICRRIGGIDERTLRRHINRFVEAGLMLRHDSSNKKRYRVRSSEGRAISYGLCISPLIARAEELTEISEAIEHERRDRLFLRKKILVHLAHIDEAQPNNTLTDDARKTLRRKLEMSEYRAMLTKYESLSHEMSTVVDIPETTVLSANDGQTVRHLSKSKKERIDLERTDDKKKPSLSLLTNVCEEATAFATGTLSTWEEVERHACSLAPMMGIHSSVFEKAKNKVGASQVASTIFIILQLGNTIRDFASYFHSVTLGRRETQFDPRSLLNRMAKTHCASY